MDATAFAISPSLVAFTGSKRVCGLDDLRDIARLVTDALQVCDHFNAEEIFLKSLATGCCSKRSFKHLLSISSLL